MRMSPGHRDFEQTQQQRLHVLQQHLESSECLNWQIGSGPVRAHSEPVQHG